MGFLCGERLMGLRLCHPQGLDNVARPVLENHLTHVSGGSRTGSDHDDRRPTSGERWMTPSPGARPRVRGSAAAPTTRPCSTSGPATTSRSASAWQPRRRTRRTCCRRTSLDRRASQRAPRGSARRVRQVLPDDPMGAIHACRSSPTTPHRGDAAGLVDAVDQVSPTDTVRRSLADFLPRRHQLPDRADHVR